MEELSKKKGAPVKYPSVPSERHYCYECANCREVPEELKRKGKAHSYCLEDKGPISKICGVQIDGEWYQRVSARQIVHCRHFKASREDAR